MQLLSNLESIFVCGLAGRKSWGYTPNANMADHSVGARVVAFRNSKIRRHSEIKQTRPSKKQDFSGEALSKENTEASLASLSCNSSRAPTEWSAIFAFGVFVLSGRRANIQVTVKVAFTHRYPKLLWEPLT